MVGSAVAGAISGLVDSGLKIYDAYQSNKVNKQNFQLQQEALAEQKAMNAYQKYFAENSASIRAKDLQNAGLSKTLAAGSSATAPNLQQLQAPEARYTPIADKIGSNMLSSVFGAMTQSANLSQMDAEAARTRADTLNIMQSTLESAERTRNYKPDRDLKTLEYNIKSASKQLYDQLKLPYGFNVGNPYQLGQALMFNSEYGKDDKKSDYKLPEHGNLLQDNGYDEKTVKENRETLKKFFKELLFGGGLSNPSMQYGNIPKY